MHTRHHEKSQENITQERRSGPRVTTLSKKTLFWELAGGSSGSIGSSGNGSTNFRSDPPPTRAVGQDDSTKTNPLKRDMSHAFAIKSFLDPGSPLPQIPNANCLFCPPPPRHAEVVIAWFPRLVCVWQSSPLAGDRSVGRNLGPWGPKGPAESSPTQAPRAPYGPVRSNLGP